MHAQHEEPVELCIGFDLGGVDGEGLGVNAMRVIRSGHTQVLCDISHMTAVDLTDDEHAAVTAAL